MGARCSDSVAWPSRQRRRSAVSTTTVPRTRASSMISWLSPRHVSASSASARAAARCLATSKRAWRWNVAQPCGAKPRRVRRQASVPTNPAACIAGSTSRSYATASTSCRHTISAASSSTSCNRSARQRSSQRSAHGGQCLWNSGVAVDCDMILYDRTRATLAAPVGGGTVLRTSCRTARGPNSRKTAGVVRAAPGNPRSVPSTLRGVMVMRSTQPTSANVGV
mmetsp:Transcript_17730/g.45826  ORF Transcript_17730/g.45826 Transcript_17730/m.45826 type:complete len:223 (+) Transcript_17730:723-1391(+)